MPDPIPNILKGIESTLDYSRVLSGIQYLRDSGNSIRQIARFLNIPEGTLRRTWINRERAPSKASVDRLRNAFAETGVTYQVTGQTTIRQVPIVPSEQSVRRAFPPGSSRTFTVVTSYASDTNPDRPRAFKSDGPYTLGPDETLVDVLERNGIAFEDVEAVTWQK